MSGSHRPHAFLFAVICLFSSFASGQQFQSRLSEPFKHNLDEKLVISGDEFIEWKRMSRGTHFIHERFYDENFDLRLIRYDSSMKELSKKYLSGDDRKFGPFLPELVKIRNKFCLFYFENDKGKSPTVKLMAAVIDPVSLDMQTPQLIFELDKDVKKSFNEILMVVGPAEVKFEIRPSPDSTKWMVIWYAFKNKICHLAVLDDQLKKQWTIKDPITQLDERGIQSAVVDNEGKVYIGGTKTASDKSSLGIVNIYDKGQKQKDTDIKVPGFDTYQVLLVPSGKQKKVHVVGTYKKKETYLKGVYRLAISTENYSPGNYQIEDFKSEFVKQLAEYGCGDTSPKEFGVVFLDLNVFELEDSSLAMAGQFRGFMQNEKSSYYTSKSILVVRFMGDKVHIGAVQKYSTLRVVTVAAMFYPFPYKDKLLMFYDDLRSNVERDITSKMHNSDNVKNLVLAVAWMDRNGEMTRQVVLDDSKEDNLPGTVNMMPLSTSSLVLPLIHRGVRGFALKKAKWGYVEIR